MEKAAVNESEGFAPLSASARLALAISSSLAIAGCYGFVAFLILMLLLVIAVEIICFFVVLRFGLAGLLVRPLEAHLALMGVLLRSLWLKEGVRYEVSLDRAAAPDLFAMLDALAQRIQVAVPAKIVIEMNCGAWVRMYGYRSGRGRTFLGIGYDLMAVLNQREFEAVMAHEMTHAKIVRRGFKKWLNVGLVRIASINQALGDFIASLAAKKAKSALAGFAKAGADWLTRLAAQQAGAYSRQDEFDADRGAAEVCGSAPVRSSLLKVAAVEPKLVRLPWSERAGRLETEESFSGWLQGEMKITQAEIDGIIHEEARDPYSTHPPLPDRLEALPERIEEALPESGPAMSLLGRPDDIAAALIEEIRRTAVSEEEKDLNRNARVARKLGGGALNWKHYCGVIFGTLAVAMAILLWVAGNWVIFLFTLGFCALAYFSFRFARYKDRYVLPVPKFGDLKHAWMAAIPADLQAREREIELGLNYGHLKTKKLKVDFLVRQALDALAGCEYLRAHVATRLALKIDGKSIDAALGNAIASASLGMTQQVANLLQFVRQRAGLSSSQIRWGAGWAFMLVGDLVNAEAFLWNKHRECPGEATFLLLLAMVQRRRGKLESATAHAERGLALSPDDPEARKLVVECLLDAGRISSAASYLAQVEGGESQDAELTLLAIRLKIAQRDLLAARDWADRCLKHNNDLNSQIQIGNLFEYARHDEIAHEFFTRASQGGYFPEAHVGLARIAGRKGNAAACREYLLSALNMEKPPAVEAKGPIQVFPSVINELMKVGRSREHCRAWVANFGGGQHADIPTAVQGERFMVFAPGRDEAVEYLNEILRAMKPGFLGLEASDPRLEAGPKHTQPVRPVYPGVQGVL